MNLLPTLIYGPDAKNVPIFGRLLAGCAEKCNGQFPVNCCRL